MLGRGLLRERVQGAARGQALERSGLGEVAHLRAAGTEARTHQRVSELARRPRGAPVDAAVDDDAPAHAGADGEHDQVANVELAPVVVRLRQRCAGRVVVHECGHPQLLAQDLSQGYVAQGNVHARARSAGGELDHRGHADAHRGHLTHLLAHGLDQLDHLSDQRLSARVVRPGERGLGQPAAHERRRRDLGASHVDPDHARR